MSKEVGDFLIERLLQWDIHRIYGYPGDGITGIIGALNRAEEKMHFIQVRHEEMAAFMATGHAKFTGEVGVCLATSGPGAIHLLNGLYDAKLDHQPVVAIVGQQKQISLGSNYQQEVDLISLFKDVAHQYVQMITHPAQARHVIDRAIRIAKSERTVTCIIIPNDVQEMDAVAKPSRKHGSVFSGTGYSRSHIVPHQEDLQKAANILNEGKKVAMLIGAGALNAQDEVKEVAEMLGAGVAKALLGKAALPDALPYVTGAIGLLGTKASWELMSECDTLLMVGSSFPYAEFLPQQGQARGIQIDIDSKMLSIRYPMEVNLQGDSKETLKQLIPLLKRKEDRSWQENIIKEVQEWWEVLEARAETEAKPINPQKVFWELSSRLPDNCIITADSGSSAHWYARDLKIRSGMMASLSGNLASMCPGIPYAIAAKFAHPERTVIATVGDGAMQMLGINGLITISKYWKIWSNPNLIVAVINNHDLNMVTWEQRVMSGDPKFEASQNLPDMNYAAYAQSLGLNGLRIEHKDEIAKAWDVAMASDKPIVLDFVTDSNVPTIPPHISFEQMVKMNKALLKGDPNNTQVIRQTFKDAVKSFFH